MKNKTAKQTYLLLCQTYGKEEMEKLIRNSIYNLKKLIQEKLVES